MSFLDGVLTSFRITTSTIPTLQTNARYFEEVGFFAEAARIYSRILSWRKENTPGEKGEIAIVERAASRSDTCKRAQEAAESDKKHSLELYEKAATLIELDPDLETHSKIALLEPIQKNLQGMCRVDEQVHAFSKTTSLLNAYKRQLQCLRMAERIDHTASRLERGEAHSEAEKLYQESFAIKASNLGQDHPLTLLEYRDLARMRNAQGDMAGAIKLYEEAIVRFKKLPQPVPEYASVLESYADMLNRNGNVKEAEQVYEEARRIHKLMRK
ncbi:MAG TPA: tetratricopeptide repeat protein [Candidatus Obscuribacterales bacterium]